MLAGEFNMVDGLTSERRSENMRRIQSKNMKPEIAVRRLVHALGFRFRLHRRDLPGKPDLVLPRHKKIVFVHGCFWHSHGDPNCVDGRRQPKSNLDYWRPKLARNKERDFTNILALQELGWDTAIVWECELRRPDVLALRLRRFIDPDREFRYAA